MAINLIVQHVKKTLDERGFNESRSKLGMIPKGPHLPEHLFKLKDSPQVRGLHTFIRNRNTARDEFIFYANRLMRLLIEYALSLLPFDECKVSTPQGSDYAGKRRVSKICGVTILRAGETMEGN